ncbi:MAG: hypothetical protein EOO20_09560 [Chryseobacterium sp.]|nr:MAG: hypothetical protein EOO20_09560 [Chryseobacterium sp.]
MKAMILIFVLFHIRLIGFSQPSDSANIRKKAAAFTADKLAIARPVNIEFNHAAPYQFKPEKRKEPQPGSKVNALDQAKISVNLKLKQKRSWILGTTIGYRYNHTDAELVNATTGIINTNVNDYHYFFGSVNFSFFSTLFEKRIIYTSSLSADGSERNLERLRGMISAVSILKADTRIKMTLGLLINIDPSAQTPVIPIFTYEHKFTNGLIADITLPRSIFIRKYMLKNGRLSLGTELDQTNFYVYGFENDQRRYEYRQLDIRTGVVYEHAIGNFIFTGKSGLKIMPSGDLFRKNDSVNEAVFETNAKPAFYLNAGLSFNPLNIIHKKR